MVNKLLGYIFSLTGIFAVALTIEPIKNMVDITIPEILTNTYLMFGGSALVLIGLIIILQGNKKYSKKSIKGKEVPIYHKGKVVGYRRH